jgi:hypothetical protein
LSQNRQTLCIPLSVNETNIEIPNLGALHQLEWWNIGLMGSGIMQFWVNGKNCVDDKIKNG